MASNGLGRTERQRRISISQLPDTALGLGKSLYPDPLHFKTAEDLVEFRRAADYISAGLLSRPRLLFSTADILTSNDLSAR